MGGIGRGTAVDPRSARAAGKEPDARALDPQPLPLHRPAQPRATGVAQTLSGGRYRRTRRARHPSHHQRHCCRLEEQRVTMKALFIGQSYIDVTFVTDHLPIGDEKSVARDYAVSFGGNAVTAAFCCAKLGIAPDLLASVADDWLGRMFIDMAAKYGISVHHRKVAESSLSFIMPKGGERAIVRCRDDDFKHPFPMLNLAGCRALHVDG